MRAAALVILLAASTARGHGGPPMTTDVRFSKTAPQTIYIGSTLGLLVSRDGGCTVEWICERNVGYGAPHRPRYAIAADGAILATTFAGLRISRDGGCNFSTAAVFDGFVDALDVGPNGEVWIGTSESGRSNDVFVSVDHGATFTSRGLASTTFVYKSVKVAPSDASRVYVSRQSATAAELLLADGTLLAGTGIAHGAVPAIEVVAIDPSDREKLFVVSRDVTATRDDRLYRSLDGGMTFVEVLATGTATIHDVAVRGETAYVTTMVLHESGNYEIGGPAFVSNDGGATFAPYAGAPQLACVGIAPDGTPVGCGANWDPDFKALAALEAGGWNKLWRFVEIAGPIACPMGAGNRACDAEWQQLEIDLGVTGPTCGPLASDAGDFMRPPKAPEAGCGCETGRGSWGVAIAVAWMVLRRRRTGQRSACRERRGR